MLHARTRPGPSAPILAFAVLLLPAAAAADPARCLEVSGREGMRCLHRSVAAIEACRRTRRPGCEADLRGDGTLDALRTATEAPIRAACGEADATALGYAGLEDLVSRIPEACDEFTEDLLDIAYTDAPLFRREELVCQDRVARNLRRLLARGVLAAGPLCHVLDFTTNSCDRARRDALAANALDAAGRRLLGRCGAALDALGLSELGPPATREEQLGELLDRVATRARHFALRAYPPNDLGPASEFGPFPVGVTTLDLFDAARLDVAGVGPRPVTVEVYYPSTAPDVAGVPREIVRILGLDIIEVPAFRDVARAPGAFPLVVFSHGNGGVRTQSFFLTAHLASHGFVVVSPDHHGNNLVDLVSGIVDPLVASNRPLDVSFVIDELLARNTTGGDFFEGAIDPSRIGVTGHSFGGFTAFAVAGGSTPLGTFTDPRVLGIMPLAPGGASFLGDAFYATVQIPTLVVGGTLDETTPFVPEQRRPFDALPSGAAVVALAELDRAGHFTFSDICDIPRVFGQVSGGLDEACEPRHLPWRHAQDIIRFLALHFFEGVLNGSGASLGQLDPQALAGIEALRFEVK